MGKCLTLNLGRGYRMVHKCMRGNGVVTLQQGGSDSAITSGFGVQTLVPLTNWKPQPDEEVGKIEFCAEHFGLVRNLDENAQHQARDVCALPPPPEKARSLGGIRLQLGRTWMEEKDVCISETAENRMGIVGRVGCDDVRQAGDRT